jgi:hypothetical protein
MGSRLIHNMVLPKIWLSENNITNFIGRNITQYLIFERLDVVGKMTLLADTKISSVAKLTDGVGI